MSKPKHLTPFDHLDLKEGGLILAVKQMDRLHASVNKHRQVKEYELRKLEPRLPAIPRGMLQFIMLVCINNKEPICLLTIQPLSLN